MTAPLFPSFPENRVQLHAAEALAGSLTNTVRLARAMTEARRAVDLSGLEEQVGLLCAKALDLPPEQGRDFRPVLIGLLADLATLHATLTHLADPPDGG